MKAKSFPEPGVFSAAINVASVMDTFLGNCPISKVLNAAIYVLLGVNFEDSF